MFTRRHYVMTANLIKKSKTKAERTRLSNRFAKMYKRDNARFDRTRFMVACGVKKAKAKKKATRRKR